MDLECHVIAYPSPDIKWLYNDDVIVSTNEHYRVSHFTTADSKTGTTLRVMTIEKQDYGNYSCKAVNELGASQTQVELFETAMPVCPSARGLSCYRGGSSTISSTVNMIILSLFALLYRITQ